MKSFALFQNGRTADILREESAVCGMQYMAEIFCGDILRVTGVRPGITKEAASGQPIVLIATCGSSRLLDALEQEGAVSLEGVRGKREV